MYNDTIDNDNNICNDNGNNDNDIMITIHDNNYIDSGMVRFSPPENLPKMIISIMIIIIVCNHNLYDNSNEHSNNHTEM